MFRMVVNILQGRAQLSVMGGGGGVKKLNLEKYGKFKKSAAQRGVRTLLTLPMCTGACPCILYTAMQNMLPFRKSANFTHVAICYSYKSCYATQIMA